MLKKLTVNKKSKAQGLVEFALILTLLLTLLYGILETGRLMFIYASTVTAARQATRYGSATGNSPNGMSYYKDCAGIRAAAQQVGFLAPFADANIFISYDKGPGTTDLNWTCPAGGAFSGTDQGGIAATGDRVKVCVSTTWLPLVGSLVPLGWAGSGTNCNNVGTVPDNTIIKRSERTLLSSISIGVVDPSTGPPPGSGGLALSCGTSPSPVLYDYVGQVIKFTYLMTNAGTTDLTGAFTIASNNVFATCGAGYTIYPGKSLTCPGYYTISQADLDAGSVANTATAYTTGASSLPCFTTVNSSQTKKLTLVIIATSDEAGTQVITKASANTLIYYTYKLINTGNVTLTSPVYTVTDTLAAAPSNVICPSPATLAPLGEIPCTTKSHTITAADVSDGKYVNTATLDYAQMSPTTQTATATVYTSPLVLTITTVPQTVERAGQVIHYTYSIYNNSGVDVTTSTLTITNSRFNPTTCPSSIISGDSIDCTVNYTVTQTDMDTGGNVLENTATPNIGGIAASQPVTANIAVIQTDALALTISASATNTLVPAPLFPTVTATTDTFTFKYMLTNTGNTTLTFPYTINPSTIRDGGTAPLHTPLTINNCGTGDLLPAYIDSSSVLIPGQSTALDFCTATSSVTQNDLDGAYGAYITNLATANAVTKVGTRAVVSTQQTGLVATAGARLDVGITATLVGMQIQYAYKLTNTGNSEITLPASYSISTYTLTGTGITTPVSVPFVCAATPITIAINSSFACPNGSTYTTAQTTGSITNTVTPLTDPAALLVTSTPAITPLTSLCNVISSGLVPHATTLTGSVYKTTWTITNNIPATIVHINSIILTWATLGTEITNVSLTGVVPTLVWSGKTKGSAGFFPISSATNSATTKPPWPLAFNSGAQTMELTFTKPTVQIRVQLGFSDPASCYSSVGLDSGAWSCTTLPAAPEKPSATLATNAVTVNWTAVPGAAVYNVYVSQNGGAYISLAPTTTNSYTHNTQSIPGGTILRYKISAITCGEGPQSAASDPVTRNGIVSGTVTSSVITITTTVPTITGSSGASCSRPTAGSYTCVMPTGSGTITLSNYSGNGSNNRKICASSTTPAGTQTGDGNGETMAYSFTPGLDVTFNFTVVADATVCP